MTLVGTGFDPPNTLFGQSSLPCDNGIAVSLALVETIVTLLTCVECSSELVILVETLRDCGCLVLQNPETGSY